MFILIHIHFTFSIYIFKLNRKTLWKLLPLKKEKIQKVIAAFYLTEFTSRNSDL